MAYEIVGVWYWLGVPAQGREWYRSDTGLVLSWRTDKGVWYPQTEARSTNGGSSRWVYATCLRDPYALPGTDRAYGATSDPTEFIALMHPELVLLPLSSYASATCSPVAVLWVRTRQSHTSPPCS
eukprot:482979-Rhodomonas_salina.2